jgi:DHA2 family multidrug resistance protein-like MFS transporter
MLTGAELIALLAIGFFFVRRQLTFPVPLLPVDLLRIPSFHSPFARPSARSAPRCWLWFLCPSFCRAW